MSTNKSKIKKASSTESLIQLSQTELENMVQGMVANAIKPLEEEIKALKTEVDALRQSQQFICNQNDDLNKSYKSALLSTKQQKQSITELNKRTDVLMKQSCEDEIKIDELEQYDRRQNLELQGVPEMPNEDVTQITIKLASSIGVDLDKEEISIAHRLPQKKRIGKTRSNNDKKHPTIIVRFVSRTKRNEIYARRFKAKDVETFPVENMENLYINENLTQRRKRLFWITKQKAKELGYSFIWTNNGQIYVRETEESEKMHIKFENDLDKL